MIAEENKKLAQRALEFALKSGAQQARLVLYGERSVSFDLRNGQVDKLQQASEGGLGISLFVDGRYGNYSTNRLHWEELKRFIASGVDTARYLAVDKNRVLPDAARYYKGGMPDLQQCDACYSALAPDEKVEWARRAAGEVLGTDARIVSVDTSYSDGESSSYRLSSNGFEGERVSTWFSISAAVAVKGENDARPSSYWFDNALFYDKLPKEGYGRKALERALRKLGQRKVASGRYTMVVEAMCARQLLSPVVNALYGSALQQKNSFLMDSLEQRIGSPLLTLRDEPHLIGACGARYFDGEGVATRPMAVVDGGILKTYYLDTYNARKLGVEPTIASPSLLQMTAGDKELEGLVADVEQGILVTGFNGGNCNSSTGDFSYGIEGFLIEGGKLTQPVNEMNITGNMLELWQSLVAVGNDARLSSSWRIPSLAFEGVSFSGL